MGWRVQRIEVVRRKRRASMASRLAALRRSATRGRARRYVRGALIVLLALNLRPALTSVGPLLGQIRHDLGLSGAEAGALTTLPLLCFGSYGLALPFMRRAPGGATLPVASMALLVVALLVRVIPAEAALFAGSLLAGVAISVGNVAVPSIIKRDHPKSILRVTAVYTVAVTVGASLSSGSAVPVEKALGHGWRLPLALLAVPAAVTCLAWLPRALRGSPSGAPGASGVSGASPGTSGASSGNPGTSSGESGASSGEPDGSSSESDESAGEPGTSAAGSADSADAGESAEPAESGEPAVSCRTSGSSVVAAAGAVSVESVVLAASARPAASAEDASPAESAESAEAAASAESAASAASSASSASSASGSSGADERGASLTGSSGPVWRSGLAWQVTCFLGLLALLVYILIGWLPTIARDRGLGEESAGYVLAVNALMQAAGSLSVPWISRRLRDHRMIVLIIVAFGLAGCAGVFWAPVVSIWLSSALLGYALGIGFALALSFIGLRSHDAHVAARLSGMVQGIGYLIAGIGPLAVGALHDTVHGWTLPGVLLLVCTALLVVPGLGAAREITITVSAPPPPSP